MATQNLISIDLETLDTKTNAVILEVGIVVGDLAGNVLAEMQLFPEVHEQIVAGRSVSGNTILWWFQQKDEIIKMQASGKRYSVAQSLIELQDFLGPYLDNSLVLGNAPTFDCEILSDFMGMKPWPFYVERDVRTARMALNSREKYNNIHGHSGHADAMAQYMDFVTFLRKFGE